MLPITVDRSHVGVGTRAPPRLLSQQASAAHAAAGTGAGGKGRCQFHPGAKPTPFNSIEPCLPSLKTRSQHTNRTQARVVRGELCRTAQQ